METLLTSYNCLPCSLQFYTRLKDVSDSMNEYKLILPRKGIQQIMLSPSTEDDAVFEGLSDSYFLSYLNYGESSIEHDLNEVAFSGFETVYLSPEKLFNNIGLIIRKVSFSDSLTKFKTYGYTGTKSRNGASLLEELDFSKCTKLRNIDQWGFLLGWNIKKVDLSNIGSDKPAEGESDEVKICGDSFRDLQYLRTLVFPYKICRLNLHESSTIINIGCKCKGTNIIFNNIFIDTKDKNSFDYQISIIKNSRINNLFINEITTTDCSSLFLLENSEVESLHLSEKVVDNYAEHPFSITGDSKINRIYVYSSSGRKKPTDWFKRMKAGIFVRWSPPNPPLITEKVVTNKTIEEAIQEVLDE